MRRVRDIIPQMYMDNPREKEDCVALCEPLGPEYELFCLTLGFGEKLKLYDEYKKRNITSEYCDLKVELYALSNELNWYILLGEMGHEYLLFRAKILIEKMKEMGLSL